MTDFTELTQSEINGALSSKATQRVPHTVHSVRKDYIPIYFKYGGGEEKG